MAGALPAAFSLVLSAPTSSRMRISGFTQISRPLRSSTVVRSGAPGPVTTRIFRPVMTGIEKSATSLFLSVIEIDPAAMSAKPVVSISLTFCMGVGSSATMIRFAAVVLSFASTCSNSRNASTSAPVGWPSM